MKGTFLKFDWGAGGGGGGRGGGVCVCVCVGGGGQDTLDPPLDPPQIIVLIYFCSFELFCPLFQKDSFIEKSLTWF